MEFARTHPFSVRTSTVRNRPGTWDSTLVEILMDGTKIGEYRRCYPAFAETTFEPFRVGGRWFALYLDLRAVLRPNRAAVGRG